MVKGIEKFREAFSAFSENYVIIGGTACDAVLIVSVLIQRAGRCDVLDPAGCCEAAETAGIGTGYRDADIFQIHILHRTHVSSDESRFLAS